MCMNSHTHTHTLALSLTHSITYLDTDFLLFSGICVCIYVASRQGPGRSGILWAGAPGAEARRSCCSSCSMISDCERPLTLGFLRSFCSPVDPLTASSVIDKVLAMQ